MDYFRDQLIDFLKRGLMGPNPLPDRVQPNGEEIIPDRPCDRYSLGILFPRKSKLAVVDNTITNFSKEGLVDDIVKVRIEDIGSEDTSEEIVNLSNSMSPSAMGFSCCLTKPFTNISVEISAGIYIKKENDQETGQSGYFRKQIKTLIPINNALLTDKDDISFPVLQENTETGLNLRILKRKIKSSLYEGEIFTFSLINEFDSGRDENCFFQCEFNVKSDDNTPCFISYPDLSDISENDYDRQLNTYLYRHKKTYAVGHGCSPIWDDSKMEISQIYAKVIPEYEIKRVIPNKLDDCKLGMYELSDLGNKEDLFIIIERLCKLYENWISSQNEIVLKETDTKFKKIAEQNISNCKLCLNRMRSGLKQLRDNSLIFDSFRLMNRAMLLQQLHYKIDTRHWNNDGSIEKLPEIDINKDETWQKGVGYWRPFQLAFILMNLDSIDDPENEFRKRVDLIWFPTGGGKTEAYLGLAAYTIFLKRLKNKNDNGTTVLMRYTLRLLTTQQFQRAASLICACEYIRSEIPDKMGTKKITIGLWAGGALTPNTRSEAVSKFDKLEHNSYFENVNPFLIDKCPWCGAQMGFLKIANIIKVKGYKRVLNPSTVVYCCSDHDCFFSNQNTLPLVVIDEDIYSHPPALIIGTIDKFAMIVWKPDQIRNLFGLQSNDLSPPSLIIQDELHLISGPLGSIAGMYEVLIEELCSKKINGVVIRPKIIASTATVTRAKEQVNTIWGKDVFIFPPQATKANESFFAYEDIETPGRKYVGIYAPALKSHATAHVRTVSYLLEGVKFLNADDGIKNYYWTLMDYFNSIRELGHAKTRISGDVSEYLKNVGRYFGLFPRGNSIHEKQRTVNDGTCLELTSREEDVSKALNRLKEPYVKNSRNVLDMCLCTNMVSVGIDIDRLSLMTIAGQPKSTAEYIQVSSRVGRSSDGPGLVVTIFNTPKPRDRSHYENFLPYHSKIYSYVEPTSITPFSKPARERALHALMIGYVRYFGTPDNLKSPDSDIDDVLFENFLKLIKDRVDLVDPNEINSTLKEIDKLKHLWRGLSPSNYSNNADEWTDCLIYPYGSVPPDNDKKNRMWPTLRSMRNVDLTCQVKLDTSYLTRPEDEI